MSGLAHLPLRSHFGRLAFAAARARHHDGGCGSSAFASPLGRLLFAMHHNAALMSK